MARTPGSPPLDSRRVAATDFASSRSPSSRSRLNATSGGLAAARIAPAVGCARLGPKSGVTSPDSIRPASRRQPPCRSQARSVCSGLVASSP